MDHSEAAVIGGGIIGCSVAGRLAQKGVRTSLYEAGSVGREASWAGAGMLAPGGEVDSDSSWGRRSVESLALYPAFVAELEDESGLKIDFRRCGALELEYTEDERSANRIRAETQARLGIGSVELDAAATLKAAPPVCRDGLLGAHYYPEDAVVDPRQVMEALVVACERRGVLIRENHPVAAAGQIDAGAIVVAAGAWSGGLVEGAPASFPVRGHLVGYHLPARALGPIVRRGHTYAFQRSTGFTVVGSTTERVGFDRRIDPELVRRIHQRAHDLLPVLVAGSPDESWMGFRPGVEAGEPQVKRFGASHIWLAYGHYRNGILLAPITAQMIAAEIVAG